MKSLKKSYFSPNYSFIKLSILLNPGSLNRVSVIFGCLCDCLKGQTQCFLNYFSLIHIYAIFLFILESCVSWERVVTALSAHTLRNIYYLHIYDRDICSITICTNNYYLHIVSVDAWVWHSTQINLFSILKFWVRNEFQCKNQCQIGKTLLLILLNL